MISSWEQFYNNENDNKIPDSKLERKVYNEERVFDNEKIKHANAVYISNCIFESCPNTVIFTPTNEKAQILVEFSLFRYCCSTGSGGAISVTNCDSVVNTVCSYRCLAAGYGQFISNVLDDNKLSYVYRSSVSSDLTQYGIGIAVRHVYGNQEDKYVNVSNYKTNADTAIECSIGTQDSTSKVSFCSIISNFATNYAIIRIITVDNSFSLELSSSNIIYNRQDGPDKGIILCYLETTISDCCILGNIGGSVFSAETGVTITITNSKLQAGYTTVGNVVEQSTNNNLELKFVESLNDCLKIVDLKRNSMMCKCVDVSKLISLLTYVTYFLYLSN